MALTRRDLDRLSARGCDNPECKEVHDGTLYINQTCHPSSPIQVRYTHEAGVLVVECAECERLVAEIEVAEGNAVTEK